MTPPMWGRSPRSRSATISTRSRRATVAAGARVLLAGGPRPGRGWFYEPAVLAEIPPGSPAHDDELFGSGREPFPAPPIPMMHFASPTTRATAWRGGVDHRSRRGGAMRARAGGRYGGRERHGGVRCPRTVWRRQDGRDTDASSASFGLREFVNIKTVRQQSRGFAG